MYDDKNINSDKITELQNQLKLLDDRLEAATLIFDELVESREKLLSHIDFLSKKNISSSQSKQFIKNITTDNIKYNLFVLNGNTYKKSSSNMKLLNSPPDKLPSIEEPLQKNEYTDTESSSNINSNILLSEFVFNKEFLSLQAFLLKQYGDTFTCAEFIDLADEKLLSLPYFGINKLYLSKKMKETILTSNISKNINYRRANNALHWPARDELTEWVMNYALLSEPQQKIMEKLSKKLDIPTNQINLANLVYDTDTSIMRTIVSGTRFNIVYQEFLYIVKNEFDIYYGKSVEELKELITGGKLLGYVGTLNFTSFELSRVISNDLNAFFQNEDARLALIIRIRFGIDGYKRQTLEATALTLSKTFYKDILTRERVRQLQNIAEQRLRGSLSIQPSNIWVNIRNNAKPDMIFNYPDLANRFSDEKGFINFLEMLSDAQSNELDNLLYPDCSVQFINEMARNCKAPFSLNDVIYSIKEHYGYTEQQAINGLHKLQKHGHLFINNNEVYPQTLNKQEAFSQASLFFPSGASFKDIHVLANEQKYCKSLFPLDRQDHGVSSSVDEGFVYLSAHGSYRHTSYLEYSEEEKQSILKSVQDILKASSTKGIDTLNLRVDVYEKACLSDDYFFVRHVVREYGFERSIFFSGKSGADTVSLEPEFSLKGQKEAIVEMFEKDPKPRTRNDIVNVIRSRSFGHAGFYISELTSEGRLVRIDAEHYDLPHIAFADKPITLIIDRASVILNRAKRPVEAGIISDECNARFHLEHPKAWYISLLRYYASKYMKRWFFYHNVVSMMPVNGISLHSRAKFWLTKFDDDETVIDKIYDDIMADKDHIRQAIQNTRNSVRDTY